MNKQAGLINNAFIAMDAVDGVKKVGKAFKAPNNTYSDPLGTTIKKQSNKMGAANAAISNPKLASDEIDEICKVAITLNPYQKAIINKRKFFKTLGKNIQKIDDANTQHLKNTYDAIKNKQLVKAVSEGGKASLVTVPAVAGMFGAGKGAEALMKKFDKNSDNPENELERKVVGAGVTAGLLLSAAANKRVLKPGTTAINIVGNKSVKYPMSAVKKTKAGKVVGEFVKQVGDQGNKAVKGMNAANMKKAKDKANDMNFLRSKLYDFANGKNPMDEMTAFTTFLNEEKRKVLKNGTLDGLSSGQIQANWQKREDYLKDLFNQYKNSKKASCEIDDLEKLAGSKANFAKGLVVDHFFKEGLKSIPYYAAPAALGLVLNRDIKHGLKRIEQRQDELKSKIKNNEKTEDINKTAGYKDFSKIMNGMSEKQIKDLFTKQKMKKAAKISLERGADGLGRTVFPAAVTAITGRNIMNSFKKLEDGGNKTPQEDMAHNIVIQVTGNPTKRNLKKQVSKEIDEKYSLQKKAIEGSPDIGDVLSQISDEIQKEELDRNKQVNADEKLKSRKVHVGNGIKKQFRML